MKKTIFLTCLSAVFFLISTAQAAEYLRPPFALKGEIAVPNSDYGKDQFPIQQSYFESAWTDLKINVHKTSFSGYTRWVSSKNDRHVALLTVSGEYDRGYLVGNWEYQETDEWQDKNHGPYPRIWEGSGTIVSGLMQKDELPIMNIGGTLNFSHGNLDPKSTPTNPIWVKEEDTKDFTYKWKGDFIGDVCGGPELDQYVGKKIEVGKVIKDWTGTAKIMHCGLTDGSTPVEWQKVAEGEAIYVSDLMMFDPTENGGVYIQTYRPENLHHRDQGGDIDYITGEYVLGGIEWSRKNAGISKISFLYPPPLDTAIDLVAGVIWANWKSLYNTGQLVNHSSQAVAGIKGTNYILEDDGMGKTTLEVIEGEIEFTAKADGRKVIVKAGQKAEATAAGLGELTSFDPASLLAQFNSAVEKQAEPPAESDYDLTPREAPPGAPDKDEILEKNLVTEKGGNNKNRIGIFLPIFVALAIIFGGSRVVKRRKQKAN